MKLFWFIYVPLTLVVLLLLCINLENAVIATALVAGVLGSVACILWKRKSLGNQRHQVLLALLASFSSIAVGIIVIYLLAFLGSIHAFNFLER